MMFFFRKSPFGEGALFLFLYMVESVGLKPFDSKTCRVSSFKLYLF